MQSLSLGKRDSDSRGENLCRRLDDLHQMILSVARADQVCQRFITVPGVGPLTALAFRTAVEDPTRFAKASLSSGGKS